MTWLAVGTARAELDIQMKKEARMKNRGVLSRLFTLLRGGLASLMRGAEIRHPEAVYDAAIQQRAEQHDRLREAVGRLSYLRHRLDATLTAHRRDLELIDAALIKAAAASDDAP